MRKTRRKLYGKTRRRRQRGGDKRLLYLALFAWVVAVARALGNTTVIPKNLVTSRPVYDDAMKLFTAFKSEKKLLADDVGSMPPADQVENAAIGLANLYEKSDAAVNQGVLYIAELAGEKLVEGDKTITGFFNWLSSSAFALADKLEKGTPLLLEDIPADVGADKALTPQEPTPQVNIFGMKEGGIYKKGKDGDKFEVNTWGNNNDGTYTMDVIYLEPKERGGQIRVTKDDMFEVVSLPKVGFDDEDDEHDGGRKKRRGQRKTLRRKK